MASFPSEATEVVVCSISLEIESRLPHEAPEAQALPPRFNEIELEDSAVIAELDDSAGDESSNKTASIASI